MTKAICVLLLVGVSCGKPTDAEQPTKANTPGNTGSETNMSAPESMPIANDEIRVSCKQDTDCIVIKSYCGGWASVHTSSVDVARKRYDATGAIKNCRQGTIPAPDAYCESETCAPAHVWNTGYAVPFGDYIDFNPPRGKTHFKADTLVPIRISHNDKEEALIALHETLEQKHPGILEKSTNYQVQYMGATTPGNANPFLLGNAFCRTMGLDRTKEWILAKDGGSCFFHFKFDLTSKKIIEFHVNGDA